MGWLRNNFKALKYIADAIWALNDQAKRLADARDGVTPKSVIDGADPEVQKALGIQGKKRVAVRHTKERWTFHENRFVNECISAGMSPSTIQRGLHDLGYDRTLSAVKHKVHDYKSATKPIKM